MSELTEANTEFDVMKLRIKDLETSLSAAKKSLVSTENLRLRNEERSEMLSELVEMMIAKLIEKVGDR